MSLLFFNPEASRQTIATILGGITHNVDWFIEWFTFGGFAWLIYLACSRYGTIKLEGPDDKPDTSRRISSES